MSAELSPEEILSVLADENRKRRQGRTALYSTLTLGFGILTLLYLALWITKGQGPDVTTFFSLAGLLGIGVAVSGRHKQALQSASKLARPEFVGYLAEAYATSDEKDVYEPAREGLILALPLLQDAEMLDAKQRGYLYGQLGTHRPIRLVREVLGAIHRVAGAEALPYLERFHLSAGKHQDAEWRRLGERALQILPDVRIRVARGIIESKSSEATGAIQVDAERIRMSH